MPRKSNRPKSHFKEENFDVKDNHASRLRGDHIRTKLGKQKTLSVEESPEVVDPSVEESPEVGDLSVEESKEVVVEEPENEKIEEPIIVEDLETEQADDNEVTNVTAPVPVPEKPKEYLMTKRLLKVLKESEASAEAKESQPDSGICLHLLTYKYF